MRPKPSHVVVKPYASQIHPYNTDGLTPRSSHSKFEPDQVQDHDEIDLLPEQQQSQPLLASSSTSRFLANTPHQAAYGLPKPSVLSRILRILNKVPLALGILVATILIFLAILSYSKPDLLVSSVTEKGAIHSSVQHPEPSSEVMKDSSHGNMHEPTIDDGHHINYSNYSQFPLEPLEYASECWKIFKMHSGHGHAGFWALPPGGVMDVSHKSLTKRHCSSTITYQLDKYVGLTAHLGIMAQVAAFARQRNRTLLIDDSVWTRGKWTDHFLDVRKTQPGPEPGCLEPPPQELVACPRLARHWVVNSRTAKFHLGHEFEDEYHNAYGMDIERLKPVYEQAMDSFESTIIPSDNNMKLIDLARREVGHNPYLGIHIRRGDRKTKAFKFHGGYVPLEDYAAAVRQTWTLLTNKSSSLVHTDPKLWIASDSKQSVGKLKALLPFGSRTNSLVDSVNKDLRSLAPLEEYVQKDWTSPSRRSLLLERRIRETRGMIVDFAMISGAWPSKEEKDDIWPESVVCTISSNVCKLSALFFGFDQAFKDHLWVEIDNAGSIEPIWEAFEIF